MRYTLADVGLSPVDQERRDIARQRLTLGYADRSLGLRLPDEPAGYLAGGERRGARVRNG